MDHGLKYISFYVKKREVAMGMCYNPALVRDKPLGSPVSVKRVYWISGTRMWNLRVTDLHLRCRALTDQVDTYLIVPMIFASEVIQHDH